MSSLSAVNTANQQAVAIMRLQQNNIKAQGEAIKTLIEGAQVDMPNENGTISMLA